MKPATMTVKGWVPVDESNVDVRDDIVCYSDLRDAIGERAFRSKPLGTEVPFRRVTLRLTVEDA